MYTYLMLPAAVRAEVPAVALERRERRERRGRRPISQLFPAPGHRAGRRH
ncbi:MAG TPA: hypothetical protein VGK53_15185 [Propionicimonas sp.]|jgi:hypothetical protein